jgi:hypothetical protein
MGDILKEAIADAKAVRETALENAKMALEEAFTPQLKSMLSAKLKEDDFEDEEDVVGDEVPEEEPEEGMSYEDEDGGEPVDDEEFGDEEEPEVDESKIIEIDGVQYAPIVAEEDDEEGFGDEEEEEGDLDLEAVIKELESEISEGEDEEEVTESEDSSEETVDEADDSDDETVTEADEEDEDDDKEEVEEQSSSSGIGKGTGVSKASASDEEDPGKSSQFTQVKMESIQSELDEYKEAVGYLKDKLHEVNLLNAKLLFTNKLFKEFSLDNSQKLKVVETFDRTQSTREIKLVYSTLCEQFSDNSSITKKSIKESASASVGSTKPSKESSKVISEESQVAERFKKLAGLING